jgi:hypothetical protein
MAAMLGSSWRSPAAGVRLLSRSSWPPVSSLPAAVFSSTLATSRVPGDRGDVVALGEQPGQGDLRRCGAGLSGGWIQVMTAMLRFLPAPQVFPGTEELS